MKRKESGEMMAAEKSSRDPSMEERESESTSQDDPVYASLIILSSSTVEDQSSV